MADRRKILIPAHVAGPLATRIARALFTDGAGRRATRLILREWPIGDIGGWSEGAAIDLIRRILVRQRQPKAARKEGARG